jgi:hypothetical protein
MNMNRKKKSVKKTAKKAGARKISEKAAKLAKKPAQGSSEPKTVTTAAEAAEAPGSQHAAMSVGTASPIDAAGAMLAGLLAVLDEPGGAVMAAAEGGPLEPRVRDNGRVAELAGSDIVPLSDRRYKALWAFRLIDAFAAANGAASEPPVAGTTRIVVKTDADDAIELSTFRNPSGLLAVRTRSMESPLDTTIAVTSHLVPRAGKSIDPAKVKEVSFLNDLYIPQTIAPPATAMVRRVELTPGPKYPFPSTGDPKASVAVLIGKTPALFKAGTIARITALDETKPGASFRTDDDHCFTLWGATGDVFATPAQQGYTGVSKLILEIDPPPAGSRKLALTYHIARGKVSNVGSLLGANNTARTKLVSLVSPPPSDGSSPIEAKDVPAIHMLLM